MKMLLVETAREFELERFCEDLPIIRLEPGLELHYSDHMTENQAIIQAIGGYLSVEAGIEIYPGDVLIENGTIQHKIDDAMLRAIKDLEFEVGIYEETNTVH